MAADLTAAASAITFPDSPTRNRTRSTQPASLHTQRPRTAHSAQRMQNSTAHATRNKATRTCHKTRPPQRPAADHPSTESPAFLKLPATKHRQPAKPPPATPTPNIQTVHLGHNACTSVHIHIAFGTVQYCYPGSAGHFVTDFAISDM